MKHQMIKLISTSTLAVSLLALSAYSSAHSKSPSFEKSAQQVSSIEVAFVLDTTGSMGDLIAGAKQKIWSIANTIVDINPDADIRMALVAYRDVGDEYVVRLHKMSTDIQGVYGNLVSLRANGGGDTPESVNEALNTAIDKISWTEGNNTRRIVFLVGDAPPHMDYGNAPKYPEVLKQATQQNITVHAIQAGLSNETARIWKDIAQRGGGSYIPIPQNGGQISQIQTPYDQPIIELQRKLDGTVVPYGTNEMRDDLSQKLEEKAAGSISKRVDNSAFYSKRSSRKEVVTGDGDIVAAIRNEDIKLGDVAASELPAPMQSMSPTEQRAYIDELIGQRVVIENDMLELVKKREEFIIDAEKSSGSTSNMSFDQAVRNAL